MNSRFVLSLICASLLLSVRARAQSSVPRGLWGSAIAGYGAAAAGCTGSCPLLGRTLGYAVIARLGGTLRPNLLLGAEISGWFQHARGQDDIFNGSLLVVAYPWPGRRLFLDAGIGLSTYQRDGGRFEGTGAGVSLGIGHDFPWTETVLLNVSASVLFGYVGRVGRESTTYADNWRHMALVIGGGVTIP